MNGIVAVFGADSIQTHTRVQLILKNLLVHIENNIDNMTPSELCAGGRVLTHLRKLCLSDEDGDVEASVDNDVDIDGNTLENEEEEIVISSLFPSTNRRDMMQLCDTVLARLATRSKNRITSFTAKDMNDLLGLFDSTDDTQYRTVFDAVQKEVDKRIELVRAKLAKNDHITEEDNLDERMQVEQNSHGGTYTSRLRKLLSKKQVKKSKDQSPHGEGDLRETMQVVDLLRDTLNTDALHKVLLRNALDAAYDMGRCRWSTTQSIHHVKTQTKCISQIYP